MQPIGASSTKRFALGFHIKIDGDILVGWSIRTSSGIKSSFIDKVFNISARQPGD
jgi:hypothetical protein